MPSTRFGIKPDIGLQKLIDGALFNEKIINTYPLAILGVVLVISGAHWFGKVRRWRRRVLRRRGESDYDLLDDEPSKIIREDIPEDGSIGSSGSSTYGSNTPSIALNAEDEHGPLLHNHHPQNRPSSPTTTILSHLKAFLIYQPRPIPYFNKLLPSNGSSIFIISFLALNLFYTFYNIPFTVFEASVLGDRAALVFGVNLPLLYILGAKNQPLKALTGVSYESLNIIHRRLGELLMFEAFDPRRRHVPDVRWYELFLGFHVVLQAAALIILYFHHRGAKVYVGLALVVFLVDRLVYRLCAKSLMAEAHVRIFPDKSTLLLTFRLPKTPSTTISQALGHSISSGWHATDHVFLSIPSLGQSYPLQAHPFTIASLAPLPSTKTSTLTLLIRARHGFTSALLQAAQLKPTLPCRLDGPYGSRHARTLLEDSHLAILIAGGSGIAVTWPLAHHLLHRPQADARGDREHCVATRAETENRTDLDHPPDSPSFVDRRAREARAREAGRGAHDPGATTELGRPDLDGLIEGVVHEWGSSWGKGGGSRIGVVVSGPDGMNRTVNNTCAGLVRRGQDLKVTVEKFGW
ncbi:hypothetical protein EYC84_009078 [Monilinia fructicola]|uniref:FAD-binding FR-type domain-containing protein n=1 Tax=Monilinia fructicola TaxID=38448 RepID=A0A5M9JFC6_MONFR|nr:hypothetical protein EYC84_009078 [Monilinia fructicola]